MKLSSRNRLTHRQLDRFPDKTLFEKIARAVCRANTLPRKELYEAWETARRVRRSFRGGRVLDLACGHGLLAHILLILDNSSETALAVDRDIPSSAKTLHEQLIRAWPRLENRIVFIKDDIQNIEVLPDDLVVSVHACGSLTDQIMEKAAAKQARIAVLPCCHNLKTSDTGGLGGWMDKSLAVDTMRAVRLQAAGYRIITRKIPNTITPKNRLLMGEYSGCGKAP